MTVPFSKSVELIGRGTSAIAVAFVLLYAGAASAQTAQQADTSTQAQTTGTAAQTPPTGTANDAGPQEPEAIVVTGTRIDKAGFDQPTPTTVIGATELREGARPNLQQVLNDLPEVRSPTIPQNSAGNVNNSGAAQVNLRGLDGTGPRTLVLLNGRRFVGENNLNFIPQGLVGRVEVVTGGASAAYGSGAVAGVVNVILNDKLNGLSLGVQDSISSRGDGHRYGFDGSFGTSFASGRGHFIVGAEYINDAGISPDGRAQRPFLGAGQVPVVPGSTTDFRTQIVPDVNIANTSFGGLITSGALAGQVFNPDGTLRPLRNGTLVSATVAVGGADLTSQYDNVYVATPFKRVASYARATFDLGSATVWVDGNYGRVDTKYPFLYDPTIGAVTVSTNNAFLPAAVRNQLPPNSTFTLARYFSDAYTIQIRSLRQNYEGAVGIDGSFGRFKYSAHYSHGEQTTEERLDNLRLAAKYTNALNSVLVNGAPTCAINADAITTNDDPACYPINPFGFGNVDPRALAYTTGTQNRFTRKQLDAAGAQIQGDLFSLPGGAVTAVIGGEYRKERQSQTVSANQPLAQFALPLFASTSVGSFDVKEGFGEIAVPVVNLEGKVKLDLNGAGRYSDYSNTGGIWSWKGGGTLRLFNDLLLRGLRSRDIRSPTLDELFLPVSGPNIAPLGKDYQTDVYGGKPGYQANPTQVNSYTGGNPLLRAEVASTVTYGATYSPSFVKGFSVSFDYYDINIAGAVGSLNASQLTQACSLGVAAACNAVVRDPVSGTVTTAFRNYQNLAFQLQRGYDFEASYVLPLSRFRASMPGTLRFRGLANYLLRTSTNNGVVEIDSSGGAGRWRGTFSASYQSDVIGFDARVRYVGSGPIDVTNGIRSAPNAAGTVITQGLVDNHYNAYTYLDLGIQFHIQDRFTLFGNVNNVFNIAPPLQTTYTGVYDEIGTYFTAGARVKF